MSAGNLDAYLIAGMLAHNGLAYGRFVGYPAHIRVDLLCADYHGFFPAAVIAELQNYLAAVADCFVVADRLLDYFGMSDYVFYFGDS